MGKHFVNAFTEYKSPEISNRYVKDTLSMSNEPHVEFSIVDNSLDDGNFEKLSTYYAKDYEALEFEGKEVRKVTCEIDGRATRILYVRNDKNTGYGSGCNLAMKAALAILKPDYLIVSNNDMLCLDGQIDLRQAAGIFAENPQVGIVGVNIQNLDGSAQSPCRSVPFVDRWILPELLCPFSRKFKKHTARDLIRDPQDGIVYRVRGSFMLLRPEAFVSSGGFDENLFLYGEEPTLAERMKRVGYSVYHFNGIHMLHNHVMDDRTLTNNEIKKVKQRFGSEMYYYKTYRGTPQWQIRLAEMLFGQYHWRYARYEQFKSWRGGRKSRKIEVRNGKSV